MSTLKIWEQPNPTDTITAFARHTVGFAIAMVLLSIGAGAMAAAGLQGLSELG